MMDISHSYHTLAKAIASLKQACGEPVTPIVRDATIQRFEYTFELAWKVMQRIIRTQTTASVLFAKDAFREAARVGLIDQAEPWFEFLKARNLTSHTYNEATANETYQIAKRFLPEAEKLLEALERMSHATLE